MKPIKVIVNPIVINVPGPCRRCGRMWWDVHGVAPCADHPDGLHDFEPAAKPRIPDPEESK